MKIDLTGQTAVVTGAASGIGRAIAQAFLDAGASVMGIDLSECEGFDCRIVDVSDYESLKQVAATCDIDHLVCAAAVGSGKTGLPFWNLEPADWRRVLEINLLGVTNTLHAFAPFLLKGDTDRKSVALLASVAGQIGSQTDPPYSASKAAVINFAQCAAKDFAAYGVRVNVLSPGMVDTPLNRSVYRASAESDRVTFEEWAGEKIRRIAPLARWQTPPEFGAMAVFLASDHARNITGQTINIDGGQVMHA
jgi:NAD(P)-dependent dehydrogenase (short-subunit alcohol dehydrogenase family)